MPQAKRKPATKKATPEDFPLSEHDIRNNLGLLLKECKDPNTLRQCVEKWTLEVLKEHPEMAKEIHDLTNVPRGLVSVMLPEYLLTGEQPICFTDRNVYDENKTSKRVWFPGLDKVCFISECPGCAGTTYTLYAEPQYCCYCGCEMDRDKLEYKIINAMDLGDTQRYDEATEGGVK